MRTVMIFILVILAFTLVACGGNESGSTEAEAAEAAATATPTSTPTPWPTLPPTNVPPDATHQGHIYRGDGVSSIHTVQAGETLAQISNLYSVPLNIIANANRIYDIDSIDTGEILFIPPCE